MRKRTNFVDPVHLFNENGMNILNEGMLFAELEKSDSQNEKLRKIIARLQENKTNVID